MEPVKNSPQPQAPTAGATDSAVSLSSQQDTLQVATYTSEPQNEDTNAQIIENLKEQRDQLRGLSVTETNQDTKSRRLHKIRLSLIFMVASIALGAGYKFILAPRLDQSTEFTQSVQKTYTLPSDLKSKTSEEQNALAIIALARKNDAATIVNTYLNKARLGQSEADFNALIASYSSSADGEAAELIEKTVGKVDFASTGESSAIAETTSEFEAASLIYKSDYFNHTNNIYLKINLYKPDPTVDAWKMYIFEFKAGDEESPLKAEVAVPI